MSSVLSIMDASSKSYVTERQTEDATEQAGLFGLVLGGVMESENRDDSSTPSFSANEGAQEEQVYSESKPEVDSAGEKTATDGSEKTEETKTTSETENVIKTDVKTDEKTSKKSETPVTEQAKKGSESKPEEPTLVEAKKLVKTLTEESPEPQQKQVAATDEKTPVAEGEEKGDEGEGVQQQVVKETSVADGDETTEEETTLNLHDAEKAVTMSASASLPHSRSFSEEMASFMQPSDKTVQTVDLSQAMNLAGGTVRDSSVSHTGHTISRIEHIARLVERFDQHILSMIKDATGELKITITPENLGRLEVRCKEDQEGMVVQVQAENASVCNLLQQQEQSVRSLLEQNGFKLTAFDVSTETGESMEQQKGKEMNRQQQSAESEQHTEAGTHTKAQVEKSVAQGVSKDGVWLVA